MNELMVLTEAEQVEYKTCKAVVKRGFDTFIEVGESLIKIRDKKLYRQEYATFDECCRTEFGFQRSRAYQMIESSQVYNNLSTNGIQNLPTNERQARALAQLPPAQQPEAWAATVTTSNGKPPTARQVADTVKSFTKADQVKDKLNGKDTAPGSAAYSKQQQTQHKPKATVTVESQVSPQDDYDQSGGYDPVTDSPIKRVKGFTKDQLVEMLGEFDDFKTCPYCGK